MPSRAKSRTIRSYTLSLSPNAGKAEDVRFCLWWATAMLQAYINAFYAQKGSMRATWA